MSGRGAWPALCAALALAAGALWLALRTGWDAPLPLLWDAASWRAAPWTLLTAALTHQILPHVLANALALGALAVLGRALGARPRDALALALAWPLATLALLWWPAVGGYYGLSALVHAGVAILALRAIRAAHSRWIGQVLAAGLLIKLALERGWAVPVGFDSGWGFNVVYAAHLTGAAAGVVMALLVMVDDK